MNKEKRRPTIGELQAMLDKGGNDLEIVMLPNGEIRAEDRRWKPITTAPKTDKDFFLICCDDPADDRSPMVVRGDIFEGMIKKGTPEHLSMFHITHWMALPPKPVKSSNN